MKNIANQVAMQRKVKSLRKQIDKIKKSTILKLDPLYRQHRDLSGLLAVGLRKKYDKLGFVEGAKILHTPSKEEHVIRLTAYDFEETEEYVIYPMKPNHMFHTIPAKECVLLERPKKKK